MNRATPERSLASLQLAFADHLRDPSRTPPPVDVDPRRMAVYRELVTGNIEVTLASAFPVLRDVLAAGRWEELVRCFLAEHTCRSPYLREVPHEFLRFLKTEGAPRPADPPFLYELAHYEWVELALSTAGDVKPTGPTDADPLEGRPVIAPHAWRLAYLYPVHRIGRDFRPVAPPREPTRLVLYRNAEGDVLFLEINRTTARLLELVAVHSGASGRELLNTIAAELRYSDPETVVRGGASILWDLTLRGVVVNRPRGHREGGA